MMEQKRMTNKEYLIAVLTNDPRVDGCDYISDVYYRIACYARRAKKADKRL